MIPLGVLGSAHVPATGPSWLPSNLGAALYAWYDAADAATITHSSGEVSQWADKSGNGRHVTAQNARRPWTGARTQNGRNVLDHRFVSGNDYGALGLLAGVSLSYPFTVAVVAAYDAWPSSGAGIIVSLRGAGGLYSPYATSASTGIAMASGSTLSSSTLAGTSAAQLISIHNGGSSVIRRNGTQIAAGNAGTSPATAILIGAAISGMGYGFDGFVGEVVIASGALAGTDLTNLETYLAAKWGL